MKDRDRALRSQDIQSGLQGLTEAPAIVTSELDSTLLTGMAARLATHIRGADVFGDESDIKRLKLVAANLGIESLQLPSVLNFLQEAEFVRVKNGSGGRILQVAENVPLFGDLYEKIGEVQSVRGLTEVEIAITDTFHAVAEGPRIMRGDLPLETLDGGLKSVIFEVLDQAQLVSKVDAKPGSILYSPQYWEEHGAKLGEVISAYGDDQVRAVVQRVTTKPGLPLVESDSSAENNLLKNLCSLGILPAPVVSSWKGPKRFAFTPLKNISSDPQLEVRLLDKTRAILASVRYGEAFGTITAVNDPPKLLRKLRDTGRIGPHSEIYDQYKVLVDLGVARVARDRTFSDRFHLHFIATEENKSALDAAINMLQGPGNTSAAFEDSSLREFAINGQYSAPITARAQTQFRPISRQSMIDLRKAILDTALGD